MNGCARVSDKTPMIERQGSGDGGLACAVAAAFDVACNAGETAEHLLVPGMSGARYRRFVNALAASLPDARYLEVGVFKGSTLCSAISGNRIRAVGIDNWSEFDGSHQVAAAAVARFLDGGAEVRLVEADYRTADFAALGRFNIYFYDGPVSGADLMSGLMQACPALDDDFVFIVDDWNWAAVRTATMAAIDTLGMEIVHRISVRTTDDDRHPPHSGFDAQTTDWHNGYFIAVLRKPRGAPMDGIGVAPAKLADCSLLVSITFHYVASRLPLVLDVVRALADIPVRNLDAIVMTNAIDAETEAAVTGLLKPCFGAGKSLEILRCDGLEHPYDLPWSNRPAIAERFLDPDRGYTHFVSLEDDMRFGAANLGYWLRFRPLLAPFGLIPSFLRVEYSAGRRGLANVDHFVPFDPAACPGVRIGGRMVIQAPHPYCAGFVLDRDLGREFIATPSFDRRLSATLPVMDALQWGTRERAAMGLCWENPPSGFGSRFAIPVDPDTRTVPPEAWLYHLANNYSDDPNQPFGKIAMADLLAR